MNVMLVQGTWGWDDEWWRSASPFALALTRAGHNIINGRPFIWDTELGGIGFGDDDLWGWDAAGRHLQDYLDPKDYPGHNQPENLCIVAHSHARQVVKFATHLGLKVGKVIYVSGPVRKDVDRLTTLSRANIGHITTLHGGKHDRMQVFGGLFDGHWGINRDDPQADVAYVYKEADHSSFFKNPAHFSFVIDHIG